MSGEPVGPLQGWGGYRSPGWLRREPHPWQLGDEAEQDTHSGQSTLPHARVPISTTPPPQNSEQGGRGRGGGQPRTPAIGPSCAGTRPQGRFLHPTQCGGPGLPSPASVWNPTVL